MRTAWLPIQSLPKSIVNFGAKRNKSESSTKQPQSDTHRVAVYAGTFDPPTRGHEWLIKTASSIFDKIIVAMAVNPSKKPAFHEQKRLEMLREILKDTTNVEVEIMGNEFLVDYAKRKGSGVLLRGIRNSTDFEYERGMAHSNTEAAPDIQTLFFMPPKHLEDVSSSFVKSLVGPLGWRERVKVLVTPNVMQDLKIYYLQQRFNGLAQKLSVDSTMADRSFKKLITAYADPSRAYHNPDHLIDCLEQLDIYMRDAAEKPANPELIELALWFHDVEDERNSKLAVEDSADQALTFLSRSANLRYEDPQTLQKLRSLVLGTRHGLAPEANLSLEEKVMKDIDLSVLGRPAKAYRQYADAIRSEYQTVDDDAFKAGRGKVLQLFLERKPIFLTAWFRQQYETQARRNLKKELQTLVKN